MIASALAAYRIIPAEFRLRFYAIMAVSLFVALMEIVGIASVMPLVAIMVDPESVSRSQLFRSLMDALGWSGGVPPIHVLGLFTIGLFLINNAASLLLNWGSVMFAARLATDMSSRLALRHFGQPFPFFIASRPADLANQMCNEVAKVASGAVLQFLYLIVRVVQLLAVLLLLLAIAPLFTCLFFLATGSIYAVIYRYSSGHMKAAGQRAMDFTGHAIHAANEMYSMAREIALRGEPRYFIDRVCKALAEFYRADAVCRILPILPKYLLEVVAVCALFALPIYRSMMGQDVKSELAVLATFAFAGFRVLPTVQQLYASLTILKFYEPLAERIRTDTAAAAAQPGAIPLLEHMPGVIAFENVAYNYPERNVTAVSDLSFTVARGERVVVVGDSGAGKSTLADLVLGLLSPTQGKILIDGEACDGGKLGWEPGVVGYVPQAPLIFTESIAKNIAFGRNPDGIDYDRCRTAATKAAIVHLIDAQEKGLDAVVGTDGLNFSGGERQRLAIARALYSEPKLLVLDEPVSALDPPTSRKIFELLCSPQLDVTVVVITHDMNHLQYFDKVVFMQGGRILMAGTYDHLAENCPEFRRFEGDQSKKRQRV